MLRKNGIAERAMTDKLPPQWAIDIVHIYDKEWSHDPADLWMEIFGETYSVPVSNYVGSSAEYEFQPVKPPDEIT